MRAQTAANRVNTFTPYGSLTYQQSADNPNSWTSNVAFSPDQQALFDQQNRTSRELADLQNTATSRVDQTMSQPFDYGSVGDVQDAALKAYTSRLDPMWDRRQGQTENQLANQGIVQGSEAYKNAMYDLNTGRNDAYQQAISGAINTSPQTLQMASAIRNQNLNELNALRTGSQVTNPTFSNAPQQGYTPGADLTGAAQNTYNAQMQGVNAENANSAGLFGGLTSLGGLGLKAYGMGMF